MKNPPEILCAFAVDEKGELSPTLGTAQSFLLVQNGKQTIVSGKIPLVLLKNQVKVLFCGGIGMCMLSLLEAEGVEIHPGCSGKPDTILSAWKNGTLPVPEKYLCCDHGRTCGSCPGRF